MIHGFDVQIANEVGVKAALIFNYIAILFEYPDKIDVNDCKIIGKSFHYAITYDELCQKFTYMTEKEIEKGLIKLQKRGFITKVPTSYFPQEIQDTKRYYVALTVDGYDTILT